MTPAPADLSRVLRQHGYERNMVLPEALRRRMAAELTITPSELDGHLQALQDAERETPLTPKAEVAPVEVINKSLPRRERVWKACEAIGVALHDEFTESDKAMFTEALGVKRKAAMQYLKDTRTECTSVPHAGWEQNTTATAEARQIGDPEALAVDDLPPFTTACTEHPTHTATRCEACVRETAVRISSTVAELSSQLDAATEAKETACLRCKTNAADICRLCINAEIDGKLKETETRVRTETAAQYQAQLNRAVKTMGERGAANRELADKNLDLAQKLEATERELGAEKEAAALLRVKANTLQAVSDEKRRWVEAVTDVHTVLDNAGVTAGVTPAERVVELARQRDAATTALENTMRENSKLKEAYEAINKSQIFTNCAMGAEIAEALGLEPNVHERDILECIKLLRESAQERDGLIERLNEVRNELAGKHSSWMTYDGGNSETKPELADAERDFALSLLQASRRESDSMQARARILQLAADLAALAASR